MQLNLVRKWGDRAEYFIIAGDDDQTIYTFTGATPDAFLDPDIPDDHKIILKQSYRVPRAVHGLADDADPPGRRGARRRCTCRARSRARSSGSPTELPVARTRSSSTRPWSIWSAARR